VELRDPEPAEEPAEESADESAGEPAEEPADEQSGEPTVEVRQGVDVPVVRDVPAESAEPHGRRYPSTVGGAIYLLVLAAAGVGLVIVVHGDWRLGVRWIGGSLFCAAVARLVVPARDAGMLAVRRRLIDVTLLAVVGVLLWFLAGSIPNQPPL
jgi:hypothetical protein